MFGLAKYAGSKYSCARIILPALNGLEFDWYIEPFMGNSPFLQPEFFDLLDPRVKSIWISDINPWVYGVAREVKYHPERLRRRLLARINRCAGSQIATRIEFDKACRDAKAGSIDAFLFVLRLAVKQVYDPERATFSSMSWHHSRCDAENPIPDGFRPLFSQRSDLLRKARETARHVNKITKWDFRRVLKNLPDRCVLYLDPPFHIPAPHEKYPCYLRERDHEELADILHSLDPKNHRWMLNLGRGELAEDLYLSAGRYDVAELELLHRSNRDMVTKVEYLIANFRLDNVRAAIAARKKSKG